MLIPQRSSPFCYQRELKSEQGCASPRAYSSHTLKGVGNRAGRGNRRCQGTQYGMMDYVSGTHCYRSVLCPRHPLLGRVRLDPWLDSLHPSGETEKLVSGETEICTVFPSLVIRMQLGLGGDPSSAPLPGASWQLLTEKRFFPATCRSPHVLPQPGLGLEAAADC